MFKSESVHVAHSIKPEPCLGEGIIMTDFFLLDAPFIILVTFKAFTLCSLPLPPPHLLFSSVLQPQVQTPLCYVGKESSRHVRFLLGHTPRGGKRNQNT